MENMINNIITLDNNEKFVVLNQALYKNVNYFLVNKVSEDEEEPTEEFRILQEVEYDGEKALQIVKDEKIIEILTKYFMPSV